MSSEQSLATATTHHRAGRLREAEAIYRQILALQPNHAEALYLLGVLTGQLGQTDQAIALMRRAIAAASDNAIYHRDLGVLYQTQGKLDQTIACYTRALELKPDFADAHYNLGIAWILKGETDKAIACYRRAADLKPDFLEAHYNLGMALYDQGQLDSAIACYRRALAINPKSVEALGNLGITFRAKGLLNEAIALQRKAIALEPNSPEPHNNLAHALLSAGQLAEGWTEYEWRWKSRSFEARRPFPQPIWTGSRVDGTILLTTEQGYGDTIQFIRYAPMVADRCQRVLLQCHQEIIPLLRGVAGLSDLIPLGMNPPPFDAHCSLLSLPQVFATTRESIPARVSYLTPDPTRVAAWAARLGDERRLKVGLAWAGSPAHKNDHNRSICLATFAPLAEIPGAVFVSLQKGPSAALRAGPSAALRAGPPARQTQSPPDGMEIIDPSPDLHDFADTAALIANLDLVISVDTVIVHLAGALAKPVWTLLPFSPDWRWMLDRSDSPWYPTMRLFRQPSIGDWASVIQGVAAELREWTADHGR